MAKTRAWSRGLKQVCFAAAALLVPFIGACNNDASTSKGIVGVWTWNPREVLPPAKIEDKGFPTPTLESYRFDADGHYLHVRRIPGYDTDVGGKPFHVTDKWYESKGTWSVSNGMLAMESAPEADGWAAQLKPEGWASDMASGVGDGLTYKVEELTKADLRLTAVAIGDVDHTLHRTTAMPERPVVK